MATPWTKLKTQPWQQAVYGENPNQSYLVAQNADPSLVAMGNTMTDAAPNPTVDLVSRFRALQQKAQAAPKMAKPQVVPVAKGSGLTMEEDLTDKQGSGATLNQNVPYTQEQWEEMTNRARQMEEFDKQSKGIDELRDLAGIGMDRPSQLDLSPLVQLAESESGKKIGYTKPESGDSRLEKLRAYMGKIQDDKRDLFKSMVAGINAGKSGTLQERIMTELGNKMTGKSEDPNKFNRGGRGGPKLKTLPISAIKDFTTGQEAIDLSERLIEDIKNNKDVIGPWMGLGELSPSTFGSEKIERMKNLQAQMGLHQQTVGKLFEGGVLRKEDEIKYNKLFTNIRNNPDVAIKNMKQLTSMLRTDVARYMENLGKGKYDTSGFQESVKQYGKGGLKESPDKILPPAKGVSRTKDLEKMSKEELDAYEKSLKGGR